MPNRLFYPSGTPWWTSFRELGGSLYLEDKVSIAIPSQSVWCLDMSGSYDLSWCGSASDWADDDCVIVVKVCINYKSVSEQTVCTVCTVQNVWWKESETGVKRAKWHSVRTEYVLRFHSASLLLEFDQTIKTCMYIMCGWVNELKVYTK